MFTYISNVMAQDELFWFVFVSYSILSACVFGMIWISSWKMDQRQKQWSTIINPQIPEEGNTMGNTNKLSRIWLLSTILGVFNYLFTGRGRKITNKNFNQDIVTIRGHIVWSKNAVVNSASYLWSKAKAGGSAIQGKWEDVKSFCELKKIAFDSWMEERAEAKAKAKAEKAQVKVEEVKAEVLAEPKQSLRSRIFGPSKLDIVIELLKETNVKLDTLTEVVRDLDPALVSEPKMPNQDVLHADDVLGIDPHADAIFEDDFEDEACVLIELPSITMENAERVIEESRVAEANTEVIDPIDDEVEATSVVVEEEPEMVAELVEVEKEKEEIRLQIDAHYQAVAEKYHVYNLKQQSIDSDCGREGNLLNLPNAVGSLKEMISNDPNLMAIVQDLNPEWQSISNWSKLRGLVAKAVNMSVDKATA